MADLVLLHGPPASGKYTTGLELSKLTGARVFHNHLTLDVAKSLLTFGEVEFWDLVRDLRLLALASFFEHGSGCAVMTWCYEEPEDRSTYNEIASIAEKFNGRVLPVFLECSTHVLEKRVDGGVRREMGKLCDVVRLREILVSKNYPKIPNEVCMTIDSGVLSAKDNAQRIKENFKID